ncbi:MAG: hypothetical protein GY804_05110 [Alphaproteobacteria bacterium]|nr:hypothetical protein [Alphaproteobacteria bacterium]
MSIEDIYHLSTNLTDKHGFSIEELNELCDSYLNGTRSDLREELEDQADMAYARLVNVDQDSVQNDVMEMPTGIQPPLCPSSNDAGVPSAIIAEKGGR